MSSYNQNTYDGIGTSNAKNGDYNTAFGFNVLTMNYGSSNTGVGSRALASNTEGKCNTAVGTDALADGKNIKNNTAVGFHALLENTGKENTAIGFISNETSKSNYTTAIGSKTKASADYSIALGYSAKSEYKNSTAIGYEAQTTTENQIRLGKSGTSVYLDDIQLTSDKRDKTDIKESSLGLDFILGLNPVEYKWDRRESYKDNKSDGSKKDKRVHHGFIAQDFQDLGFDFGGFQDHKLNGGEDQLSLNYLEFIAPLTKAIQEQQKIIEKLEEKLLKQQEEIDLLKKGV